MNCLSIYLITFITAILVIGGYIIINIPFKKRIKNIDIVNKWFMVALAGLTGIVILVAIFTIPGVMSAATGVHGHFQEGIGCINLVGVPYGEHRFLNFLAWLGNALLLPGAVITVLTVFFPSKVGKLVNKYISLPTLALEAIFVFNYVKALTNSFDITFESIVLSLEVALSLATSLIYANRNFKDLKPDSWKEIVYFIVYYLFVFIASLPVHTFSTLFNTEVSFLGTLGSSWRIQDMNTAHRMYIYVGIIIPVLVYFANRDRDLNANKTLLVAMYYPCS